MMWPSPEVPRAMQVVDLAPAIVLTAVGGVLAPWSRMPLPIFLVVVGAAGRPAGFFDPARRGGSEARRHLSHLHPLATGR